MALIVKGTVRVNLKVPLKTAHSGLNVQQLNASYTKRLESIINTYKPINLPKKYDTFASDPKLASAAYLTKTIHESGKWLKPTTAFEKEALAKDIVTKEQVELLDWARRKNLFIEPIQFTKKWEEQGRIAGNEQQVIINGDTVTKRKLLWPDETWLGYFNRLSAHRELSPETAYSFIGFTEVQIGNRSVTMAMTDQKFVTGRGALPSEVDSYMFNKDFVKLPLPEVDATPEIQRSIQKWLDPKNGVVVYDLNSKNVLKTENGGTAIIDPQIDFMTQTEVNTVMQDKTVMYEITLLSHDSINNEYISYGFNDYFSKELQQAGINRREQASSITVTKTEYDILYPLLQKKVSFMDVDKQHLDPRDNVYYITVSQVLRDNA